MHQYKKSIKRKITLIISLAVVSLVIITGGLLLWKNMQSARADGDNKLLFSFDESKSPGWWTPGSYPAPKAEAKDINGESVPLASIAAFKGKEDDHGNQCFIMAFYTEGSVDVAAKLKAKTTVKGGSAAFEPIGTMQQTILTPEGSKKYTLHQYDLNQPNSQRGNEYGIIPLGEGYIEVSGVCPTADMLPSTKSALDAISLKL